MPDFLFLPNRLNSYDHSQNTFNQPGFNLLFCCGAAAGNAINRVSTFINHSTTQGFVLSGLR
jgi:hypothetical protein